MKKYKLERPITLGIRDFGGTSIICYNPNNLEFCKILSDTNINGKGPHPYTLGGSVDYDNILSQTGNCLIGRDSRVLGKNIKIEGNAQILGKSTIYSEEEDKIINIKDNAQLINCQISTLATVFPKKTNNSIYILHSTIIKDGKIDLCNCKNAVMTFDGYTTIDNITLNFNHITEQTYYFYNTNIQNCSEYMVIIDICKPIEMRGANITFTNKIIDDYIQNYKELEYTPNESILTLPNSTISILNNSSFSRKIYDLNQFINYYNIQK
jgi:hypothetical protein